MSQSLPIQVDGNLVGAAVRQEKGVRFIATDFRVAEMDQTLWVAGADALRPRNSCAYRLDKELQSAVD